MAIYLLSMGLDKDTFMGTRAWYFFIVNLSKVPIFLNLGMITQHTLRFDALMIPAIALGAFSGKVALSKIPQKFFNWIVLILAAIAALYLILHN